MWTTGSRSGPTIPCGSSRVRRAVSSPMSGCAAISGPWWRARCSTTSWSGCETRDVEGVATCGIAARGELLSHDARPVRWTQPGRALLLTEPDLLAPSVSAAGFRAPRPGAARLRPASRSLRFGRARYGGDHASQRRPGTDALAAGRGAGAGRGARGRCDRVADAARRTSMRDHSGQIAFPGGKIEPGDASPLRRGPARSRGGDRPAAATTSRRSATSNPM